jgi:DeoR family transcriptional regulator, fructose operon transcriptional repressor
MLACLFEKSRMLAMGKKKNNPVFAEERKIKILEIIKDRKKITVPDLCDFFSVSSATIRSDLRDLQRINAVTRTHGGAIEKSQTGFELDSKHKEIHYLGEKQRIAHAALDLIEDGDKIILDTGTTTLELAKLLKHKKSITVVTNDTEISRVLENIESTTILFLGGMLRKKFHCTVGVLGREIYIGLMADKAFMGVNSFSLVNGATTPDINQAETKKMMISIANKVVVLCDSSKMGKVSFVQFATVEQIDTIVTDRMVERDKEKLEDNGVEVIIATAS